MEKQQNVNKAQLIDGIKTDVVYFLKCVIVREESRYLGKHDYVGLAVHFGTNAKEV